MPARRRAQVIIEAETRRSRGYGFVTFCLFEHAQAALGACEGVAGSVSALARPLSRPLEPFLSPCLLMPACLSP